MLESCKNTFDEINTKQHQFPAIDFCSINPLDQT